MIRRSLLGDSTRDEATRINEVPVSHRWVFISSEIRRIISGSLLRTPTLATDSITPEVTKWTRILSQLNERLGRMSGGNDVVCSNGVPLGDQTATEMLNAINSAKRRVWMEVYIFDDSPLAAQFVRALKNAAKRGCEVILIIDYIGSFGFPSLFLNELSKHGAQVIVFNPFMDRQLAIGTMPFRNHKKILVVDNDIAFCGSMNVSVDSTSSKMGGNGRFYDINLRIRGPAVCDLANVFKRTLAMTSYKVEDLQPCVPPSPIEDGVIVQVLESDMFRLSRRNGIQSSLATVISNIEHAVKAEQNVYLTTSYFYPPGFLRRTLLSACKRGLQVHMLLSGNSDVPGDINATLHVLRKFFRKRFEGANDFKVYMTTKEHCHGKCVVVDDIWSCVGSFNWDRWSSRRNLEVSVGILDPSIAVKLKSLQMEKEKEAVEYTRADSLNRPTLLKIFDSLLYKIVRFSGRNCFDGLSNDGFKSRFKKAFIRTLIDDKAAETIALCNMAGV
ncbi:phospholipase D active site motif family protein, putative [Babesia bigemina]|uniref:Phospholipase D active site motif family protein, putative n=1 Tax=Babesia bigemina TaxID=5866 RepID=A0A061D4R8_BABBI|nr:phospholipase D active site motif family protein, putative [Babesia bigemina]CDR95042.1 phospholipase D active site motif family protein, putative [Babesia bigemina]|eukprot:XP_012767228.1 phospholipase D active site motif family protein, putative [Babesia bigemina]